MPIQPDPPRRVFQSVKILQSDLWAKLRSKGAYNGITVETITEVFSDGSYGIVGRRLTTSGVSSPFKPGDRVEVGWVQGEPVVIVSHAARKAKGVMPQDEAVGVPEVLYSPEGNQSILFRNYDQWATVTYAAGESPKELGLTAASGAWGHGSADLFTARGRSATMDDMVVVYRLVRPEANTPFPPGAEISAELVRLYNLTTDTHVYASSTLTVETIDLSESDTASADWTINGGQITVSLGIFPVATTRAVGLRVVGVAPNGDLMMLLEIQTSDAGQPSVGFVMFQGQMLINHTRHTVLANHVASMDGTIYLIRGGPSDPCVPLFTCTAAVSPGVTAAQGGQIHPMSFTGSNPEDPEDPDAPGTYNNYALVGPAAFFGADFLGTAITHCYAKAADFKVSVVGEFAQGDIATIPTPFGAAFIVPTVRPSRFTLAVWSGLAADPALILDVEKARSSLMGGDASTLLSQLTPAESGLVYVQPISNADPFDGQFFLGGHDAETGAYSVDLADPPVLDDLSDVAPLAPVDDDSQVIFAKQLLDRTTLQIIVNQESLGGFFRDGPL